MAGVLLTATMLLAACTTTGAGTHQGTAAPHTATAASGATAAPADEAVPAADVTAIRTAIAAINATAGGPVPQQRAVLQRLAAPAQAATQRACPTARSTLSFQPAYRDLRLMPSSFTTIGAQPPGTRPLEPGPTSPHVTEAPPNPGAGTALLLPTFITIYTGDRITGTDLTTLHVWVAGGVARTGALCVS